MCTLNTNKIINSSVNTKNKKKRNKTTLQLKQHIATTTDLVKMKEK